MNLTTGPDVPVILYDTTLRDGTPGRERDPSSLVGDLSERQQGEIAPPASSSMQLIPRTELSL